MLGVGLVAPALIIFLLFSWMPIIKTFSIAFQKFQTLNSADYVGMANFVNILSDRKFWDACLHSGILSGIVILLGTWLPLFLALYIYEARHGSSPDENTLFHPVFDPGCACGHPLEMDVQPGLRRHKLPADLFRRRPPCHDRLADQLEPGAVCPSRLSSYGRTPAGPCSYTWRDCRTYPGTFLRTRP